MAGANNYRRSLQNLFSRGGMQKPKTPPSLMQIKSNPNSWAPGDSKQDLSRTLMSYMKQENKQPPATHSERERSYRPASQDLSKPTWRYCELCDLHFQTQRDFQIHTSGTLHAEKVLDSKTAGRGRNTGNELGRGGGQGRSNLQQHHQKPVFGARNEESCKLCNVRMNSVKNYRSHMDGKRHAETYLSKITELGFREFYEKFGDVPYPYKSPSDRSYVQPNGEYVIPKNAWKLLDVPVQFRKQVSEYIIRCGSFQNGRCKVCETDPMDANTWWIHVCGKKHTAKCAEIGLELGWTVYLKKYGAVPLLDHDAVEAIKKKKHYMSTSGYPEHEVTEQPYKTQKDTLLPTSATSQGYDKNNQNMGMSTTSSYSHSSQQHGYHSNSSHQSSRPDSFGTVNRPEGHGTTGIRNDPVFELRQAEELNHLRLMGEMHVRQLQERERRERENRIREEENLRHEALLLEEEKQRIAEEKRQLEEQRLKLLEEAKKQEEEHLRKMQEAQRREEERRRREEEQVRREQEQSAHRRESDALASASNLKVDEAVSMVSVLLKGLQKQQPELLQAAGISLQNPISRSSHEYESRRQHERFADRRDRMRETDSGKRSNRTRSRSPLEERSHKSANSGRNRDIQREMWVGGNDQEEFAYHDMPRRGNRSPPPKRPYNDRPRRSPPRGHMSSRRGPSPPRRPPTPQRSILGEPPMNMNMNPEQPRRPPTPQRSILGEPPMNMNPNPEYPMVPRPIGPDIRQQGAPPDEQDYMMAQQIQQMTGIGSLDEIAQVMTVLRSMNPELVAALGSLDPSVIQSLLERGELGAVDFNDPMMAQLSDLLQSGFMNDGALQNILAQTPMPLMNAQVFRPPGRDNTSRRGRANRGRGGPNRSGPPKNRK